MMIHAYQEIYLNNAQSALDDALDCAINTCSINGNDFVKLFLVSSICKRMENGEPAYLTGKSGIEIVRDILKETNLKYIRMKYGYTQTALAASSGVSLRSIQMYEQRNKNINKVSADTLYRLAKALGCTMEDLIDRFCY